MMNATNLSRQDAVIAVVAVIAGGLGGFAYAKAMQPTTFEECVLTAMREVNNQWAAEMSTHMCKRKFPPRAPFP